MKKQLCRWLPTLLIGAVLGFGLRLAWEKWAAVRLVTGAAALMVHSSDGIDAWAAGRGGPVRDGVFSLDAVAASADPAGEMRRWRAKVEAMPKPLRSEWLNSAMVVTPDGLRSFLARLGRDSDLREEVNRWMTLVEDIVNEGGAPLLERAVAELARLDLALALDAAEASGSPDMLNAVLMVMAEADPAAALRTAEERGMGEAVRPFMLTLQGLRDPRAMLASVLAKGGSASDSEREAVGAVLSRMDAAEAVALCRRAEGSFDAEVLHCLALTTKPAQAAAIVSALEQAGPEAVAAIGAKMGLLHSHAAAEQPDAALRWAKEAATKDELPSRPDFGRLLRAAAAKNPALATETALAWSDPRTRSGVLEATFTGVAQTNLAASVEFLLEPDVLDAVGKSRWGEATFYSHPAEALAAVADKIDAAPPGEAGDAVRAKFAGAWAMQDPAAAQAWASETGNVAALTEVARRRMLVDPVGACSHLSDFPPEARVPLLGFTLPPEQRLEVLRSIPPEKLPDYIATAGDALPAAQGGGTLGEAFLHQLPPERQSRAAAALSEAALRNPQSSAADYARAADYLKFVTDPVDRFKLEELLYDRMRRAGY